MNKQRAYVVILFLGICGCTSRQVSNLPLPESTSAPVKILAVTPTEVPATIIIPTLTLTELPSPSPSPAESLTHTNVLQISGPYLGQEPPGMEPLIFAPDFISSPEFNEFSGSFSPDGNEYYFYRFSPTSEAELLFSKVVNGKWSVPEQLAVTAEFVAFQPYVTLDNQRLYFAWGYPVPAGQPQFPYFFVDRTENGWSEPNYAGQGMFLSSSQDGQLYTTDMSSRSVNGMTYLAKITVIEGVFTDYERLHIETSWGSPAHPCIASDGSYILFDVESGNHLFVSFKNANGAWGEPVDLTNHGFDPMAGGAYISPDGEYLFFSLNKDIWWVDIKLIENLRPSE
jgi:hypothetical protein